MEENINQDNQQIIIWIDTNIENQENQGYIRDLGFNNVKTFKDINSGIIFIKTLRFKETSIILSGRLFIDFINSFKQNLKDIYIIPKIIVFTSKEKKFNQDIVNDKFYTYGGIKYTFEEIKYFLNTQHISYSALRTSFNNKLNNQNNFNPTFTIINNEKDLLLPVFYSRLIELLETKNNDKFIQDIYVDYKNDSNYYELLNPIATIPDIPIELLSKYYARMYAIVGNFHRKLNDDLLTDFNENNIIYQPYIKTLYEGVKIKKKKKYIGFELYCPQLIPEQEIKNLMNYKEKNFLRQSPIPLIFLKKFMFFTKDKNMAENIYSFGKNTMITIKNSTSRTEYDFDLSTHADMEEISLNSYEKDVLFFPFSAFGIDDIRYDSIKKRYNIYLIYFGNFKGFNNGKKFDNDYFKNFLRKTGLVEKGKIDNIKINEYIGNGKKSESDSCCYIF